MTAKKGNPAPRPKRAAAATTASQRAGDRHTHLPVSVRLYDDQEKLEALMTSWGWLTRNGLPDIYTGMREAVAEYLERHPLGTPPAARVTPDPARGRPPGTGRPSLRTVALPPEGGMS